ncbi:thioredoxin family protein [Oxalobacteraceae bacterium OM1]|nr:thioredoxin family protein [Oxalobacteraceae bacterium OM1]
MKNLLLGVCSVAVMAVAIAAPNLPYDDKADAKTDMQAALAQAKAANKKVLAIFGANWCPDCRELDKAMHGKSAPQIASQFVVVKVDVGQFDKNLDVAQVYGNPIKKGIPAAVVLTADNQVLYATRAGELANARRMGEDGIYDFFSGVIEKQQAAR